MATSTPRTLRLATAAAALVVALGLTAYPVAAAAAGQRGLQLALGVAAVATLAAGLYRGIAAGLGLSVVLVGVDEIVFVHGRHEGLSLTTPIYAAGLLLQAEVSFWSLAVAHAALETRGVLETAATTTAAVAGAWGVAELAVLAARDVGISGVALEPLGVVAAACLAVLFLALARGA